MMDLSGLNDGQRASVTTFGRSLMIAAGAGSGKTYTLANRIVYGFHPESGGGTPNLTDIDQVCAITYTKAAAGELRSRVKAYLRRDGFSEQALKVDDAWISTIHGMCSRILKANALVLGIDADFSVLENRDYQTLLGDAVNGILSRAFSVGGNDEDGGNSLEGLDPDKLDDLAREEADIAEERALARDAALLVREFGAGKVQEIIILLMGQAKRSGYGWDGIGFLNAISRPEVYVNLLRDAYQELLDAILTTAKPGKTAISAVEPLQEAIAGLEEDLSLLGGCGPEQAVTLMAKRAQAAFSPSASMGGDLKPIARRVQDELLRFGLGLRILQGEPFVAPLVRVAREADRRFAEAKGAMGALDNDDLIIMTLRAFREHPRLAGEYADRFRMVLVDEFQDTNQLQLDLITRISGPRLERLCTVGDTQQSIYRFTGADVAVAREHLARVQGELEGSTPKLGVNYRSHGDVLAFVERIFSEPEAFGDGFLNLAAGRKETDSWPEGLPRITMLGTVSPARRVAGARMAEAEAIADEFAGLLVAGFRRKDMVILLRSMTNARVYADALTRRGIPSVITRGSVLAKMPEVHEVVALARVVRNITDDEALYRVLTGEMFRVPPEELARLTMVRDTGRTISLSEGFLRLMEQVEGDGGENRDGGSETPFAAFAAMVLGRETALAGAAPLADVLTRIVTESGWAVRLKEAGTEGLAALANVMKAIRVAEHHDELEDGSLAGAAASFYDYMEAGPQESPGALSGGEGDAVRILTIHSSKGLEYPVVAVADYETRDPRGDVLVEGRVDSRRWADTLLASKSFAETKSVGYLGKSSLNGFTPGVPRSASPAAAERPAPVPDAAAVTSAASAGAVDEERAEALRLLYVALTRAREAIILPVRSQSRSEGSGKNKVTVTAPCPLAAYVCAGVFHGDAFPEGECRVDFGGSAPAVFRPLVMGEAASEEEPADEAPIPEAVGRVFAAPAILEPLVLPAGLPASPFAGVFSYSSIAHAADHGPAVSGEPQGREPEPAEQPDEPPALGSLPIPDENEDGGDEAATRSQGDEDKATSFGSAFHLCAQFAIETGAPPTDERIRIIAAGQGVEEDASEKGLTALKSALDTWFAGSAYAFAAASPYTRAEVPFFTALDGAYLEGSIDLLCSDNPAGVAPGAQVTLFDYKTGGKSREGEEELYWKHLLQAQCYAYALLTRGCAAVDAHFVRVQRRPRPVAGPLPDSCRFAAPRTFTDGDTVDYRFTADQLEELRRIILATYRRYLLSTE